MLFILLELVIIALWTVNITADLLGTSRYDVIGGADYFVSVQGRFFWDHVKSCGSCALWNGDTRGGAPAYVDANVDIFHPLVAIPAYFMGTLEGSKLTITLCMFMGGLAVWWLALELGAGVIARVVTACMAVASGSMLGKLQEGLVVLVTATAAAFLILPALIHISRAPNRRSAGLLGIILGLAVISGQGYIQLGLAIMSPLAIILIVKNPNGWKRVSAHMIAGGIIGLLISMVFVYPFMRVYGGTGKVFDVGFGAYQPMKYQMLNLAISDYRFLEADYLGKLAFAAWYVNYIGWIPIAFALVGVAMLWSRSKRMTLFLGLCFLAALWVGAGIPYRLIAAPDFVSEDTRIFAWSIRIPSFVSALAIPPLLGFAAVAIDAAVKTVVRLPNANRHGWIKRLRVERVPTVLVRLAVAVVLLFSLRDLHGFSTSWIWVDSMDPGYVEGFVDRLSTDDLAWVSPPNNSTPLQVLGMDAGLKWSDAWRSWYFDGQPFPDSYLALQIDSSDREGMERTGEWEGYSFYESLAGNQYVTASEGGACTASGEGGRIDVRCSLPAGGPVVIQELSQEGWNASVNGIDTPPANAEGWISVDAPAGDVVIELRYQPTDIWIGLALTSLGLLLALILMVIPTRCHFRIDWNRPFARQNPAETAT